MNILKKKINILNKLLIKSKEEIKYIKNINELNLFKSKYIGKKSFFYINIIKEINNIKLKKHKYVLGKKINCFKKYINYLYKKNNNINYINDLNLNNFVDITIPCNLNFIGKFHLISKMIYKIEKKLNELGFKTVINNEIETYKNNFDFLNFQFNHPSRTLNDTFSINKNHILRTHTSNIMSKIIYKKNYPIKLISYGKVYRRDNDRTHTCMFHQLDCIYINKNVNFKLLKKIIINLIGYIFNNKKIKFRIRISYFPFTEPSIELDIYNKNKWIEILGAGMISKKILNKLNINTNIYKGFAFGIGIERLIMIKYEIDKINYLYKNNINFLNNYN